jgi:uncharacterized protein (TIGR00725 family)
MPRKLIVAAIGGGEAAGAEVEEFGMRVALSGAILVTGGRPFAGSLRVTERAQAGSKAAGGLMISVLPNEELNTCVSIVGERRFEVRTTLTRFGRDPITGAAADVIFVFPGDVGTLVELSYASVENRPIVFCGTEEQWHAMHAVRDLKRNELARALDTAVNEYLPGHGRVALEQALNQSLERDDLVLPTIVLDSHLGSQGFQ